MKEDMIIVLVTILLMQYILLVYALLVDKDSPIHIKLIKTRKELIYFATPFGWVALLIDIIQEAFKELK